MTTKDKELTDTIPDEQWKVDYAMATVADSLGRASAVVNVLAASLDETWKKMIGRLLAGEISNPEEFGLKMRSEFKNVHRRLVSFQAAVAGIIEAGYEVSGADRLEESKRLIEVFLKKISAKWPFVDREAVAASRAQIERGEVYPIEDLLSEPERDANAEILRKAM